MDKRTDSFIDAYLTMRQMWIRKVLKDLAHRIASILQYEALQYIGINRYCTMKDLAMQLYLSPSSAAQLAGRLVGSGYVARSRDETDHRIIRLHLTKTGQTEVATMRKELEGRIRKLTNELSPEELDMFIKIQKKLCHIM